MSARTERVRGIPMMAYTMQNDRPETQWVRPLASRAILTRCGDWGNVTIADGGQDGGGEEDGLDEVPALGEGEVRILNTDT